jgi:hypothetical protein
MPLPLQDVAEAETLELSLTLTNDAPAGHALRVMGQSMAHALVHSWGSLESTQSSPTSHTMLPHSAPQPAHANVTLNGTTVWPFTDSAHQALTRDALCIDRKHCDTKSVKKRRRRRRRAHEGR